MHLMNMKRVQLVGPVLDNPVFHISLLHNDVREPELWIECCWSLSVHGQYKKSSRCSDHLDRAASPKNKAFACARESRLPAMAARRWSRHGRTGESRARLWRVVLTPRLWRARDSDRSRRPIPCPRSASPRSPVTPAGGPFTMNSTRAPGGTPMWVCQSTKSPDVPFSFKRHAVQRDQSKLLRRAIK